MRARLERILARYGQEILLTARDGEALVRAFLQPVLKQREGWPAAATPLGAVSRQRWLYIGSGGTPLSPGDRAVCGSLHLIVQEARLVPWKDEPLYCWALLRPGKEAAE